MQPTNTPLGSSTPSTLQSFGNTPSPYSTPRIGMSGHPIPPPPPPPKMKQGGPLIQNPPPPPGMRLPFGQPMPPPKPISGQFGIGSQPIGGPQMMPGFQGIPQIPPNTLASQTQPPMSSYYPHPGHPTGHPGLISTSNQPKNVKKPRKVFSLGSSVAEDENILESKTQTKSSSSNEGNLMEDFLRESRNYNLLYQYDRRENFADEETKKRIREFRSRMADMRANPKSYFNFGFSLEDYIRYICKHYFIRLERDMIRKSGETYNGK